MKTGFNLLLWTLHVTEAHAGIVKGLKRVGYDGVEIPIFGGTPDHYARIGEMLDKVGLERTVVSGIAPSGKNPLSPDKICFRFIWHRIATKLQNSAAGMFLKVTNSNVGATNSPSTARSQSSNL